MADVRIQNIVWAPSLLILAEQAKFWSLWNDDMAVDALKGLNIGAVADLYSKFMVGNHHVGDSADPAHG